MPSNTTSLDDSTGTGARPVANNSDRPFQYFNFFGLSRELRDMIYDQPCMLDDTVLGGDDFDGVMGDGNLVHVAATKPRVFMCLVNKKFSTEYGERCEGRKKPFVRSCQFTILENHTKLWPAEAVKQADILQLHVGEWSFGGYLPVVGPNTSSAPLRALQELANLQRWLTDLCSQMPCLRTVQLKLYVSDLRIIDEEALDAWLHHMASLEKLERLKVVDFEHSGRGDSLCWDLRARHHLMVDWKAEELKAPEIINPAPEYAESCCEGLEYGEREWDELSDYDYDGTYLGNDPRKRDMEV